MMEYATKITALYSRLSVGDEDRNGGESNSIVNQKDKAVKVNQKDSALILVDDFIGSGDTATKAVNNLLDLGIDKKNIYVFALVAQNIGVDKLKAEDISITVAVERKKGITDFYGSKAQVDDKIKIMRHVEKKLKVGKDYRLGYKRTEALVSMIKTPNNTFPVFWKEPDDKKKAPFPRGW